MLRHEHFRGGYLSYNDVSYRFMALSLSVTWSQSFPENIDGTQPATPCCRFLPPNLEHYLHESHHTNHTSLIKLKLPYFGP